VNGKALALLGVFVAALLVHAPARHGKFLFFDDERFVVRNRAIDSLENPGRFFTDLDTTASAERPTRDIYRPLRTLSYATIVQLWGKNAAAFHGASVFLHAVCAALLAAVLLAAGVGTFAAAGGALLFALHPATVEVTAWVCSLGDIWCGLFALLSILMHGKDRRILAHVALLLALLGKEHAVVVPGIWLAWDYFLRPERLRMSIRRAAAPGLALVIAFLVFRGQLGVGLSQVTEPLGGSHWTALLTMLAGLGFYGATVLFPHGPTFQARVPVQHALVSLPVMIGVVLLAVLIAGCLRGTRRTRLGCVWFCMALLPVSNVLVPLKIPTADRFLYLPMMGAALAAADVLHRQTRLAAVGVPAVCVLLAALTVTRIGDWKDDNALMRAGLRVNPRSHMLVWAEAASNAQHALALMGTGQFADADRYVNDAIKSYNLYLRNARQEDTVQVYMELGELLYQLALWGERLDRRAEALRAYGDSLQAFMNAHKLHRAGKGRVIEEEVQRAAEMVARISIRLAEPGSPQLMQTIRLGNDMLKFLEKRFSQDIGMRVAQLQIVYASQTRSDNAQEARRRFEIVLKILAAEERKGRETKFLRAQTLMYLAILKDRDPDRQGLENAQQLFKEVAQEDRDLRMRALFLHARTYCLIAKLFADLEARETGRALLQGLDATAKREKQRMSKYLKQQIRSEFGGCGRR